MKPHRGTLVLVLGILGLILEPCGVFLAIPAWIMGKNDLAAMDAGQMDTSGRSLTNAGRICGIIATIMFGLFLVGGLLLVGLGVLGSAFRR